MKIPKKQVDNAVRAGIVRDRLEAARKRLLEAQRTCSWCGQEFPSSDALVEHVWDAHKPEDDPR